MVKARQIVGILDDEQDADRALDLDPYLTLSFQVTMDPRALTKKMSTWAPLSPLNGKAAYPVYP